jgi:hypothetical protein
MIVWARSPMSRKVFSDDLLRSLLVRRRANGGDAKFATPLLEKTMDVHGLGVRLDGDVLGVMTTLFDVVEEIVEHVRRLRFLLEEVGVSVTR